MGHHENWISNVYVLLTRYEEYVVRSNGSEKQLTYNCLVAREEEQAVFEIKKNCKQRQEKAVCAWVSSMCCLQKPAQTVDYFMSGTLQCTSYWVSPGCQMNSNDSHAVAEANNIFRIPSVWFVYAYYQTPKENEKRGSIYTVIISWYQRPKLCSAQCECSCHPALTA